MRRTVVLLLLSCFVVPAFADDKDAPAKPLTKAQAADAVLVAFKADDAGALKALAERDEPDPWRVADLLCYRGEHDAAEAFARAAPRRAVEKLPAYIATRRGVAPDHLTRKKIAAMNESLRTSSWKRALEALGEAAPLTLEILPLRMASGRGNALAGLLRIEEAVDTWAAAGLVAEELGWLAQAVSLYQRAGYWAWRGAHYKKSIDVVERLVALHLALGDQHSATRARASLALVYGDIGQHEKARALHEQALAAQRRMGDKAGAARTLGNLGSTWKALGEFDKAHDAYQRALAQKQALGDAVGAASTLSNIGSLQIATGDVQVALETLQRALAAQQGVDAEGFAKTLNNIAIAYDELGRKQVALATYERALAASQAIGDRAGVARTLGNIGTLHQSLGSFSRALDILQRARRARADLGDQSGAAQVLINIGIVHYRLGNFTKARANFRHAHGEHVALGEKARAALALGNIGSAEAALGNQAEALAAQERALTAKREVGDRRGAAGTLSNLGILHDDIGDHERALTLMQRALAEQEAVGDKSGAALTLGNMAAVYARLGEHAKALDLHQQSLARKQALGDRASAAVTMVNIGHVHEETGEIRKALGIFKDALRLQEELGSHARIARTLSMIGNAHGRLGEYDQAREPLERAVRIATRLRAVPTLVIALQNLALLHLSTGDSGLALLRAREGLRELESMLGALSEEEGALARGRRALLFAVGTLASIREKDIASAVTFMESGRAGALLEALGNREVLRWQAESLPEHLRAANRVAREAHRMARRAYEVESQGGKRKAIALARTAVEEAADDVRAVSARIQRELKREAGLYYPRPETVESICAALEPDEALVIYGLCVDEAIALVVRRAGARVVPLGARKDIVEACGAFRGTDVAVDATEALARLKTLLTAPLKLGADVTQVLVSPEGPLCYLPLAALFDQVVTATPSGTTHVLLTGEPRVPGKHVLALGDPDYGTAPTEHAMAAYRGGTNLARLPATRIEAQAVGDTVLLGTDATESRLRETVAKEAQWRAVHLACHGLVLPAKPMQSSLALTRGKGEDGFLTGAEVLRMEIPADLVVLSACETATGRVIQGEGIVGLTRAFMFAGSPRVICSLWRVDDEATQALMVKFYELWNPKGDKPGLGAAAALKQAQAFVRGHKKWEHPYYWAAWVLWGLPR